MNSLQKTCKTKCETHTFRNVDERPISEEPQPMHLHIRSSETLLHLTMYFQTKVSQYHHLHQGKVNEAKIPEIK